MFREKRYKSKKKVMEADRKDPIRSHRPDLPVTGPGEYIHKGGGEGNLCKDPIRSHRPDLPVTGPGEYM